MSLEISNLSGLFDGMRFHNGPLSIEIANGKIVDISSEPIANPAINGKGKFASLPFFDGHTHLIWAGDRSFELDMKIKGKSYLEIMESGGGILNTVKTTRDASESELLELVLNRLDIMLEHGTLSVEGKSGYGLTAESELKLLRVLKKADSLHPVKIVSTYCGAHSFPADMHRQEYIDLVIELIPEIERKGLATSTDVFCDRGAYTVSEARKIFSASKECGLPVRVHADELAYTGIGRIAATEFGALSADHLLFANQIDFQALQKSGTVAMFLPAAVIGLFSEQRPFGWKGSSVEIGLGTDFNPNNKTFSMQTAVRLAVYLYRMDTIQAFRAATVGSYKGVIGASSPLLREGEDANITLFAAESPEQVISNFDLNLASHVIKEGKVLNPAGIS